MSIETNISWADSTASPWFGCTEVSPGCVNCYARELTLKYKWAGWGDKSPRVRSKGFEKNVRALNRKAWVCNKCEARHGFDGFPSGVCPTCAKGTDWRRVRVFPSLMDWLDPLVPIEWLADFLKLIHETPNLDWLLLTKRPELFYPRYRSLRDEMCKKSFPRPAALCEAVAMMEFWQQGEPPANVWIGVTVENQKRADERIPELLKIPARVRWLSVEPLLEELSLNLGEINYDRNVNGARATKPSVDWVVVGGESGGKRRDCGAEAIYDVAKQCVVAGVPVWVKQDSAYKPGQQGRIPDHIWAMKQLP